ncbi:hypothetical protein [Bacillus thuringiensis]|uniref:hypothetical protein n=1 Tax=Bacillus thuringiensis TaxID=1428 RepID=UPI001112368C|nr:hypothetical protein [Bacillus thuringiensis]QCY65043.1 hypothetical protein FHE73_30790 [Bacillus thuringiensis]
MAGLQVTFNVVGGVGSPTINIKADVTREQLASEFTKRVEESQLVRVPQRAAVQTVLTERIVGVTVTEVNENRTTATLDDIIFE